MPWDTRVDNKYCGTCKHWKEKEIDINELENDIIKIHDSIFTDDIKTEALDILYFYYNKNT